MKSAKFILGAVAVLAIAGGAFAFKAKQTHWVYIPTTTDITTECTSTSFGYTTLQNNNPSFLTLATTNRNLPCAITRIYTTD